MRRFLFLTLILLILETFYKVHSTGSSHTLFLGEAELQNNLASFNDVNDTSTVFNGKRAAHFSSAKSQGLQIESNSSLQGGLTDLSFVAWAKFDSVGNLPMVILSKDDNATPAGSEYYLGYYPEYGSFVFQVETAVTTRYVISSTGKPAANRWYFVAGWYERKAGKVKIQIDNGAIDSITGVEPVTNVTGTAFAIGAVVNKNTGMPQCCSFMNGSIKSVGMFKRILSESERTALYNESRLTGTNNGLIAGGAKAVTDVPSVLAANRYAMNYDGKNDKTVFTSSVMMNSENSSLSLWFKADSIAGTLLGYSQSPYSSIKIENPTTIEIQTNAANGREGFTVPAMSAKKWYNLIMIRKAGITTLYVNGVRAFSDGLFQKDPIYFDQIAADWQNNVGFNFHGKVADVKFFKSALSPADINAIQKGGIPGLVPCVYYKLNDTKGEINKDYGTDLTGIPLEYDELPETLLKESKNTFISYWNLDENSGIRCDSRVKQSVVGELP